MQAIRAIRCASSLPRNKIAQGAVKPVTFPCLPAFSQPILRSQPQSQPHLVHGLPKAQQQQRRHFLPNPFNPFPAPQSTPQTLHASKVLPYPPSLIYSVIADVPQYSSFLPFCQESVVTRWSGKDGVPGSGKSWPDEAKIVVGWGSLQEEFHSRIYCVPGKIVEAIGGRSKTTLGKEEIRHHLGGNQEGHSAGASSKAAAQGDLGGAAAGAGVMGGEGLMGNVTTPSTGADEGATYSSTSSQAGDDSLLTHLLTRWTVTPLGKEQHTRVSLDIQFQFANPLYTAMSAAATPKVADMMIKAFEERLAKVVKDKS